MLLSLISLLPSCGTTRSKGSESKKELPKYESIGKLRNVAERIKKETHHQRSVGQVPQDPLEKGFTIEAVFVTQV